MTVVFLLGVGVGAISCGLGCNWWHRTHTAAADIDHYAAAWDPADREALVQDLAVVQVDKGRWHRHARRLEQIARNQAALLAARRRPPIPLPARRSAVPTYGARR